MSELREKIAKIIDWRWRMPEKGWPDILPCSDAVERADAILAALSATPAVSGAGPTFSEYRSEMMELSSWLGMGLAPNAPAKDLASRIREGVQLQVNVTLDQAVSAIEEASKDYHNTTYGDIVRAVKALRDLPLPPQNAGGDGDG